jgi:hypothetical protein
MKYVRFTLTLPKPLTGVMEYDDQEYEDAVSSGELYYHGLNFLQADEALVLTHELVESSE